MTASDAAEGESLGAMVIDEAAATADPLSQEAAASSTGSPMEGITQPAKKIRTVVQLPAAATAADDVTMAGHP
jgi:hypothetical protein